MSQNASAPVELIRYPFPLDDGSFGWLDLPRAGLAASEAERLKGYVDTLVVQPKTWCSCIHAAHCDGRASCALEAGGTLNDGGGVCPPPSARPALAAGQKNAPA